MEKSEYQTIREAVETILRTYPGSSKAEIHNLLSFETYSIDCTFDVMDQPLNDMVSDQIIEFVEGGYYMTTIPSEAEVERPKSIEDRLLIAVRMRGHFLWLPRSYDISDLESALNELKTDVLVIEAQRTPDIESQLSVKFSLRDSFNNELANASGIITRDFFVLTTVAYPSAIPVLMQEVIEVQDPGLAALAMTLPLYSLSYIALIVLQKAQQSLNRQVQLVMDKFSVVELKSERGIP